LVVLMFPFYGKLNIPASNGKDNLLKSYKNGKQKIKPGEPGN